MGIKNKKAQMSILQIVLLITSMFSLIILNSDFVKSEEISDPGFLTSEQIIAINLLNNKERNLLFDLGYEKAQMVISGLDKSAVLASLTSEQYDYLKTLPSDDFESYLDQLNVKVSANNPILDFSKRKLNALNSLSDSQLDTFVSLDYNEAKAVIDSGIYGKEFSSLGGITEEEFNHLKTIPREEFKTQLDSALNPEKSSVQLFNGQSLWDNALGVATYAGIGFAAGQAIGLALEVDTQKTNALSWSLATALGGARLLGSLNIFSSGWGAVGAGVIGLGVGALMLNAMYEGEINQYVTYTCSSWQAPLGGENCESCNNGDLPCTPYKCSSLGQGCEIINENTDEALCYHVNPDDIRPAVLSPFEESFTVNYSATNVRTSPPGPGFEIVNDNSDNGCVSAFETLKFGISADKPVQCGISLEQGTAFEDMIAFGGNSLFRYNHTDQLIVPNKDFFNSSGIEILNDNNMTLYVKCQTKNGIKNEVDYAIRFCVDPTPDTTPPVISALQNESGVCVQHNHEEFPMTFYLNEPSNCSYSYTDTDYIAMPYKMNCSNSLTNPNYMYKCNANLTTFTREGKNYYVRCNDSSGNYNEESFVYNLRSSQELNLTILSPKPQTIYGPKDPLPIELTVQTKLGCDNGLATCFYSDEANNINIPFKDTNNLDGIHTQDLYLDGGRREIFVKCVDSGGNVDNSSVEVYLDLDKNEAMIIRQEVSGDQLRIQTAYNSDCVYSFDSCDYTFEDGTQMPYPDSTEHIAQLEKGKTYHIKCRDKYRYEPTSCSAVISVPTN